ncbi:hypothetical protein A2662_00745 [Candidatus Giovannonibacteria bacterium RIFCSPHIGHO2_01_FULL_45_33]|uniref:MaoC-like domain-containing protein n=1 Tax=Candidatus Giovannonibacteria bacterium RIFCSPLOWO2_01_FULL_45_34 TaxID=1798351 RepID=A0A1F5WXX7_9BACT|nr:MAG: hypothetical protein A2662_00745 [Candidatus Giovannonibacteria bacterium RIFCSPHIGHO2_01_FULL_45_33]OGF68993.1 MAG: hypothetical protein A3C73_04715 [Candidatus Giovannonibacteria bacterium RIFCSPHIGHO2_02_FULL_44_11]OGF80505.1 MAG: hypothetical protein A2930_02640 [Candidatus Giovannonibacteria bacterium RIFCSPLOWO2_01_FULL_45_34]
MKTIDVKDIAALQAEVSEKFGPWGPEITVTQDKINLFADATEDRQWIHVDVERAKRESPFRKKTIAHGFLVMSLMPALMPPPEFELTGYKMIINNGGQYRFMGLVLTGSTLHARTRLAAIEKIGKRTLVTQAVEIAALDSKNPDFTANIKFLYA